MTNCPNCNIILGNVTKRAIDGRKPVRCRNCGFDLTWKPPKRSKTVDDIFNEIESRDSIEKGLLFNPDAFTNRMDLKDRYEAQQTPEGQAACKVQQELTAQWAQITGKPVKSGIVKAVFDEKDPGKILQYYED